MKKCPGCGSIDADADTTCGVCGNDLRNVSPMQMSLDQSIAEDTAKKIEADARLENQDISRIRREWFVGLTVGLSTTILGFLLLFYTLSNLSALLLLPAPSNFPLLGIPIGMYLAALGLTTLEVSFDLFEDAPYHTLGWFLWIRMYDRDVEMRRKRKQSD